VDTELVSRIARTAESTAANKRLPRIEDSTSYVEVRLAECHSVLDDAVRILGDVNVFDYGVLLASYNGLTDKDFFQRSRRYRLGEFIEVFGGPARVPPWRKKKCPLVTKKRERVYAHVEWAKALDDRRECA